MFKNRITVTAALPYVNGMKHLGNLVGSILPADIFHRFLDLFNVPNIYICGTDDHGSAVEIAANKEGVPPREYADKYYSLQKSVYEDWNIDFSYFGRTSSKENYEMSKQFFENLEKNNYILKKKITLPYCKNCNRFLSDRFIRGECPECGKEAGGDQCEHCSKLLDPQDLINPACTLCNKSNIEFREEEHFFLNLKRMEPTLKKWLKKQKHWPSTVKNNARGWLREGLEPRCITRNTKWGIPLPKKGYEHLTLYVWFDAPIGYISITKKGLKSWKKWWSSNTKIYHFLGKDNIPFHTIFWPAMLIGDGRFNLPHYVAGYEYLNWEGGKFSTSKKRGLFADKALELYPASYWRYYLSRILPESSDSNFKWRDFQAKINNELIANYGNIFHRVTKLINKTFGKIPQSGNFTKEDKKLIQKLEKTTDRVEECIQEVKLKEALHNIMGLATELNKYFQNQAPWKTEDKKRVATILYISINVLRSITTMLWPYIPSKAEEALNILDTELTKWPNIKDFILKPGQQVKDTILFNKIDPEDIDKLKAKENLLNIQIGKIIKVEDHPNADKLYILQIDLNREKRQVIAGLKNLYEKKVLQGRKVPVLTNLEPVDLRGKRSNGMILACEDGTLLEPNKELKTGKAISAFNQQISYEEFLENDLGVKDNRVYLNDKKLPLKPIKKVEDMKVI